MLLGQGRGAKLTPGEFRRSQVWIGGTRPGNAAFVLPPANEVEECLKQLEGFLHDWPEPTPPLVKAALAHLQFETIHPFLDGNGRVGRLLIALQLAAERRAPDGRLGNLAALQRQPIATAASLASATGLTPATVNKSLAHLERIGVVAELTRRQRGRVFSYARYADILNEGMALPDR